MAIITIKINDVPNVTATLFGSISSSNDTHFSWDSNTNTGTFSSNSSTEGPTITYLPFIDYSSGSENKIRYKNCVALELKWNSGYQTVILSGNVKSATWYNGDDILPESNSSYICPNEASLTVTPVEANSLVSNEDYVSKVTIGGYWETGTGSIDGQSPNYTGTFSNPVAWAAKHNDSQTTRRVPLSWSDPTSLDKANILYYIVVGWKGNWGSNNDVATSFICSRNASSVLDDTNWWDGAETAADGNPGKLLYTVHALYSNKGLVPSLDAGQSQNKNQYRPEWGIWRSFADNGQALVTLRFYNYNNGNPIILRDATTGDTEFTALKNKSQIRFYIPKSGFPQTQDGTYYIAEAYSKNVRGGIIADPTLSENALGLADADRDIGIRLNPPTKVITFDPNGGVCSEVSRKVKPGDPYGELPDATREDYLLTGWFTAPTGGDRVTKDTVMGDSDVTVYAQWQYAWDYDQDDLYFIAYKRPVLKIGARRMSLQDPDQVVLLEMPELCPLPDKNGNDRNYMSSTSYVKYREEQRGVTEWARCYESRAKYNNPEYPKWTDASGTNQPLQSNRVHPTDLKSNSAKTKPLLLDIDKEWQIRARIYDALEQASTYKHKQGEKTLGTNDKYNTQSAFSNIALLLKYVTKLFVHNPFLMDKIKESGRIDRNDTDYWQIREHIQDSQTDRIGLLNSTKNPILKRRSDRQSVNGFDRDTEVEKLLIPTLKRKLAEEIAGERLVFDYSQEEKLIAIINKINNELTKNKNEIDAFGIDETNYVYNNKYEELEVGNYDAAKSYDQRILEADGERHHKGYPDSAPNGLWVTEPDSKDNRVRDTVFKKVELNDFVGSNKGTADHIYDYDVSQLDLERSISDYIYILSRMTERQAGSEGPAESTFNDPNADIATLVSKYRTADNEGWKDNAFSNWKNGQWTADENDINEYASEIGDAYSLITNINDNPANFSNNGCKAACMGLCENQCYSSCVGACKTACGDSCFHDCNTSCTQVCGGSCTGSCSSVCARGCANSCNNNCSGGCQGDCKNQCGPSNPCKGTCSEVCKQVCNSKCQLNCGTACSTACQGNCGDTCQGGCLGTCNETCQGGCQGECGNSCYNVCKDNCQAICSQSCTGGCSSSCADGCSGSCAGKCLESCTKGCGESCDNGCFNNCKGDCSMYCSRTCTGRCVTSCTGRCITGCAQSCASSCGGDCDAGCFTVCADTCVDTCRRGCKVNCSSTCQGDCAKGCSTECTTTCNGSCIGGCTKYCIQACQSGCGGNCTANCANSCWGNCNGNCTGACKNGCKTQAK